jgi:hypothetical protein
VPKPPEKHSVNNALWDHVLDPLHDLLAVYFAGRIGVRWDSERARGEYYQIKFGSPTEVFEQRLTGMETRRYQVRIDYVRAIGGESGLPLLQRLSERIEDIKGLLNQNLDYSPSGVYTWHAGQVESIDYDAAEAEEIEQNWHRVAVIFSVSVTKEIT